jgi:small subunit ribosomal protein S8
LSDSSTFEKVNIPSSKVKCALALILKEEGFIRNYKVIQDSKQGILRIYLKYFGDNRDSAIFGIQRISKPGCRVYVRTDEIPGIKNGIGTVILSTNQGIMTDKRCREKKLGGEVICSVW